MTGRDRTEFTPSEQQFMRGCAMALAVTLMGIAVVFVVVAAALGIQGLWGLR